MSDMRFAIIVTATFQFLCVAALLVLLFWQQRERNKSNERWTKVIQEICDEFAEDLKQLTAARTAQVVERSGAEPIVFGESVPEVRAQRAINEQIRDRGIVQLAQEYRQAGIDVSEEQIAREVDMMLNGIDPYVMAQSAETVVGKEA